MTPITSIKQQYYGDETAFKGFPNDWIFPCSKARLKATAAELLPVKLREWRFSACYKDRGYFYNSDLLYRGGDIE